MPTVLLWIATTALAAPPQFTAEDPAHAEIASEAWRAAEVCTGWVAPAHKRVEIAQGYVRGGYHGGALIDERGLALIEVGTERQRRSLLHEVAHAWVRGGPAALTEGRTDLLADCIALATGGPLDPDSGRDLDHLPNLRMWDNPQVQHRESDLDEGRADAYLGAARLLRVVSKVLPEQQLWPVAGTLDWDELAALLEPQGPSGHMVLALLDGGPQRQAAGLSDRDHDGVPWLGEILTGTNPDAWDSDGDGWWDGASEPPSMAAIPLPLDGTPVCSGYAAGAKGGRAQALWRGELRNPQVGVRVWAGDTMLVDDPAKGVSVPAGVPVLLGLRGSLEQTTGGAWAMAGGQDLVLDWNCRSSPAATVTVADPVSAAILEPFTAQLTEHISRANGLLGRPSRLRTVVSLGDSTSGVTADGVVRLSTGLTEWVQQTGRIDALSALTVALHRVWQKEVDSRRWDTAEALTRALVDDPPSTLFVAVDKAMTAAWEKEAASCPDGWHGVLRGDCRPQPDELATDDDILWERAGGRNKQKKRR
jgi:hypothetical protein